MKYVVSSTLSDATWRNSEILGPYDPDAIRSLKEEVGDVYTSGSDMLVRAILADGLVDRQHLLVYPLTRDDPGFRRMPFRPTHGTVESKTDGRRRGTGSDEEVSVRGG